VDVASTFRMKIAPNKGRATFTLFLCYYARQQHRAEYQNEAPSQGRQTSLSGKSIVDKKLVSLAAISLTQFSPADRLVTVLETFPTGGLPGILAANVGGLDTVSVVLD